jgi:hypothetical protein
LHPIIGYAREGRHFLDRVQAAELFLLSFTRILLGRQKTAMIRIEGIPIVAARLAAARKAKSAQTHDKRGNTSKTHAGVKPPLAAHRKSKAA